MITANQVDFCSEVTQDALWCEDLWPANVTNYFKRLSLWYEGNSTTRIQIRLVQACFVKILL